LPLRATRSIVVHTRLLVKNAQATILIIDDDQSFTNMIEQKLTTLNYSFMSSTNPNVALHLFTGFPGQFDPVMVDEIMPTVKEPI